MFNGTGPVPTDWLSPKLATLLYPVTSVKALWGSHSGDFIYFSEECTPPSSGLKNKVGKKPAHIILPAASFLLTLLLYPDGDSSQYVPPKRRLTSTRLHCIISQNTVVFKTSRTWKYIWQIFLLDVRKYIRATMVIIISRQEINKYRFQLSKQILHILTNCGVYTRCHLL